MLSCLQEMHSIKIEYRRFWRKRTIETIFPECWSEMNARQFTALFSRPNDVELLSVMMGVSRLVVRRLSLVQVYELAQLFDFIKRDRKVSSFWIESFVCPGVGVLYSPKAKFGEMPFEQFIYADTYYMQYVESGKMEDLHCLVAYLYVPKGGFSKQKAKNAEKYLRRADRAVLEAIGLNYGLVRKWVAERYPLVFPVGGKRGGKETGGSWPDVFDNIVGDDLKDRDKYGAVPVNVVFKFITRKIKEMRRHGTKV